MASELLAGDIGGPGNIDGVGTSAKLNEPFGIALDSDDNLYITQQPIHNIALDETIRKITPDGVVTTFAGTSGVAGTTDGIGAAASFTWLAGIAYNRVTGSLYAIDQKSHTIREIALDGTVKTIAGAVGSKGFLDGVAKTAKFSFPCGISIDREGNTFIADQSNHAIRKMDETGLVSTIAGGGSDLSGNFGDNDGMGRDALFHNPTDVAADNSGNVYVADISNARIRKATYAGGVSTIAGSDAGEIDGQGTSAKFNTPRSVAIGADKNIYVADADTKTIRRVTPDGNVTTVVGASSQGGSENGRGTAARLGAPYGLAFDSTGNLFIADRDNSTIRKVSPSYDVTTFAGTSRQPGSADGAGTTARFDTPTGVVIDSDGSVFIVDQGNSTIRKVTTSGDVNTFAGAADARGAADGAAAVARFSLPSGAAIDAAGTIYIADTGNYTIRAVALDGNVRTLAGRAGVQGSDDGGRGVALFRAPTAVAVKRDGTVYVADAVDHTIRRVTSDGTVSTVAGEPGVRGHVDGKAARFDTPMGIAVDPAGNVYVADSGNSVIRKILPDGTASTLAGSPKRAGDTDGVGNTALFWSPNSLAIDGVGNLYVTDRLNFTIRRITPGGDTTTIAGASHRMGIVLGTHPGFAVPRGLAIAGDSLIITDTDAVLVLHHAVKP